MTKHPSPSNKLRLVMVKMLANFHLTSHRNRPSLNLSLVRAKINVSCHSKSQQNQLILNQYHAKMLQLAISPMTIWLMKKLKLHLAMKRLNVSYKSQTQRSLQLWSSQPKSMKKCQIWRNKIKIPKTLIKVKSRLLMMFLTLKRLSNLSQRMIIQWSRQSMFSLKLKISRRKRLKSCQTKRSRKQKQTSNQRM